MSNYRKKAIIDLAKCFQLEKQVRYYKQLQNHRRYLYIQDIIDKENKPVSEDSNDELPY